MIDLFIEAPALEPVNITFEFVGGPDDGKITSGHLGEPSEAERFYLFSDHGRVGHRLKLASQLAIETLADDWPPEHMPHSIPHHYYVVTDRLEDCHEVWVRAEYLPQPG